MLIAHKDESEAKNDTCRLTSESSVSQAAEASEADKYRRNQDAPQTAILVLYAMGFSWLARAYMKRISIAVFDVGCSGHEFFLSRARCCSLARAC